MDRLISERSDVMNKTKIIMDAEFFQELIKMGKFQEASQWLDDMKAKIDEEWRSKQRLRQKTRNKMTFNRYDQFLKTMYEPENRSKMKKMLGQMLANKAAEARMALGEFREMFELIYGHNIGISDRHSLVYTQARLAERESQALWDLFNRNASKDFNDWADMKRRGFSVPDDWENAVKEEEEARRAEENEGST